VLPANALAGLPLAGEFAAREQPWMGRKAWLFASSELAGQRAAIVMSLVQSAKLNGHDPWAYLQDVPAIGAALMCTRLLFGTADAAADNDDVVGSLMITFSVMALGEVARRCAWRTSDRRLACHRAVVPRRLLRPRQHRQRSRRRIASEAGFSDRADRCTLRCVGSGRPLPT
jgi:IS66 C-terminal element